MMKSLSPLPHFAPATERAFQTKYYNRVRPTLRVVSGLLSLAMLLDPLLGLTETTTFVGAFALPQLLWCVLVFGLTWAPGFARVWQPVMVLSAWCAAGLMFGALAWEMVFYPPPIADAGAAQTIAQLSFTLQVCVFMIALAAFRLHFASTVALQLGVVAMGVVAFSSRLAGAIESLTALQFLAPVLFVLLAVLLIAYVQEGLARGAFEFNLRLSESQAQEHRKRVETEAMLRALNGAIGSIVHDIGNPLTSVQTGAALIEDVLRDDKTDREMLRELNRIVTSGAQMLGFLRLSLIEQTRVLEGAPIPVEPKAVSLRALIEAGAGFQKTRMTHGHSLEIEGEELSIQADEMKMVTVAMNLLGNALKYSDGAVRVHWQTWQGRALIAVCDQGTQGRGLTRESAALLFRAFGRLETHAHIEGTGLGLLSIQGIVQAHGGEVFIEGYEDNARGAGHFSTARSPYPSMLAPGFRTAFVVTCPLAPRSAAPHPPEHNSADRPAELARQSAPGARSPWAVAL